MTIRQQPPRLGTNDRAERRTKATNPLYKTREWRNFIEDIVRRRGRQCQRCLRGGVLVRIFGDHIIEIKDGGPIYNEHNIELLCGSCHTKKTLQVRAERRK